MLFVPKERRNIFGAFVNPGYCEWQNITEKKETLSNTYHQEAITLAFATIDRFEKPESTIPPLIDNSIKGRYETYPKIVHAISRVIHVTGKQGIALCGHWEELDGSKPYNNRGIFLSILTEFTHYVPALQEHLKELFRKDVTYLSPTSQHEIIDIIGKNIIQETLLNGVKKAGMHSISAEEVTSSNDKILSICMRYLDEFQNICKVFIGFLDLERITGEYIGETILKFYHGLGLAVKECKGQCYDGTANLQSKNKGVASVILREAPNSVVTHCCSHKVNLSLAASFNLAIIDNILEVYKSITIHLNSSPKKKSYWSTLLLPIANLYRKTKSVGW